MKRIFAALSCVLLIALSALPVFAYDIKADTSGKSDKTVYLAEIFGISSYWEEGFNSANMGSYKPIDLVFDGDAEFDVSAFNINRNTGANYGILACRVTEDPEKAITGVIVSSVCAPSLTENGIEYTAVAGQWLETGFFVFAAHELENFDLNYTTSASPMYLYTTKDKNAGAPIGRILLQNKTYGYELSGDMEQISQNINEAGDEIVLAVTRTPEVLTEYEKTNFYADVPEYGSDDDMKVASIFSSGDGEIVFVTGAVMALAVLCLILWRRNKQKYD